ncbi:hypothetical protein GWK47_042111 [Chionoecetes opilio]|uniref:Uncharacterized protein n=1 Tax=Chionoecetes opilio TaxID=41210 RepID=A0A8J4YNC6_CHIOP|nr:hypothetical protein GWK47_042111 [Chionoecetes opilio]
MVLQNGLVPKRTEGPVPGVTFGPFNRASLRETPTPDRPSIRSGPQKLLSRADDTGLPPGPLDEETRKLTTFTPRGRYPGPPTPWAMRFAGRVYKRVLTDTITTAPGSQVRGRHLSTTAASAEAFGDKQFSPEVHGDGVTLRPGQVPLCRRGRHLCGYPGLGKGYPPKPRPVNSITHFKMPPQPKPD